jgi:hypothetical protein
MDSAVALVEAYLHANGYFTVTEYPIIEALDGGAYRVATDIDVMAIRLPKAGRLIPGRGARRSKKRAVFEPDPVLRTTDRSVDLLIGEVKEGQAILNEGARARLDGGPRVRVVAFGSSGTPRRSYHVITLGHILEFFHESIEQHWGIMNQAHFKHPGMSYLMLQEKIRRREERKKKGGGRGR